MPIPALVGAALISSAASTGTAAMQNSSNNKRALANAQLERQWQLEDRLHDEQYNSPAAQLGRLRDAGINPLLSSGAANVEQVPTQSSTVDGPVNVPQTDLGALVGSSFTNLASSADLELRKEELELAKKKTNSEIKKTESDILVNDSVIDLNEKLGLKTDQERNVLYQTFQKLLTENKYYDERLQKELNLLGIEYNEKQLEYKFNYDTFEERKKMLELTNKKIKKEIDELASRIGLNKAMAALTYGNLKKLNMELAYGTPYWQARSFMYQAKKDGLTYNQTRLQYEADKYMYPILKRDADFRDSWLYRFWHGGAGDAAKTGGQLGMQLYGIKSFNKKGFTINNNSTFNTTPPPMSREDISRIYRQDNWNTTGNIYIPR